MLLDKFIKNKITKAINELITENKDKALEYVKEHKTEILDAVKTRISAYVEEHKEEIINYALDTAKGIIKK